MNALLSRVHAKRRALDDARGKHDHALGAASKQKRRAEQLRQRISTVRESLVQQRAAAPAGSANESPLSANDVLTTEIDAEAAELLADQLDTHAAEALGALNRADKAWHEAVCTYVQDLESTAIGEVEAALASLSSACARAIAAADISRQHGQIRGSFNLGLSRWYGSAGQLVHELRSVEWPEWPTPINDCGFRHQYINENVLSHPGVEAAIADIHQQIEIGDDR